MPEPQLPNNRKITISFRKSSDYRIYSATDLWGGPTADGAAVFFHLAIDHFPTPSYQSFIADDQGRVNPNDVKETITSGDVEKELLCGIMFTPEVAKKIGSWLVARGQELIDKRGG